MKKICTAYNNAPYAAILCTAKLDGFYAIYLVLTKEMTQTLLKRISKITKI